jgi:hypothetical protein
MDAYRSPFSNDCHKLRWEKQYSQRQRFWPLKCLNWNLGASHLPEVCWKGWKEWKGKKGEGANLTVSFLFLPSFCGPYTGSWADNGEGYLLYMKSVYPITGTWSQKFCFYVLGLVSLLVVPVYRNQLKLVSAIRNIRFTPTWQALSQALKHSYLP